MPQVAVVIPVFNEAAVLPELFARVAAVCDASPAVQWSVWLVDDGSGDGTAALLEAQVRRDARFHGLQLSRNFGHQAALTAGIAHAGDVDAIITMDADLQDPPELMPRLLEAWQDGAEVVLAVRTSRQERGIRRLGFELFHRLFERMSDQPVEPHTGTYGLLARPAVEAFRQLPEQHRFFPGLRAWVGFTRASVTYERQARAAGEPAQTMRRLVRYALDGIFSFSRLPLRLLTFAGIGIACVGFAVGLYFAIKRIVGAEVAPTGFTTLVTLVLFVGGVQLIGIGIVGEYLGRIFDEVKRRPPYIVRRRLG